MAETTGMSGKEYRQQWMALKARLRYSEPTIARWKRHLDDNTFPSPMPTLKPCPKMGSDDTQWKVDQAYKAFKKTLLTQMIKDMQDKVKRDKDSLEKLVKQRRDQRRQQQKMKSKKIDPVPLVLQLQQQLKELQAKVDHKELQAAVDLGQKRDAPE